MKKSAGLIMYRFTGSGIELLLGHMGGPFWAKKDSGAWTIFKGEYEAEEPLQAAQREFKEETGIEASGDFIELGSIKSSAKEIKAWAFQGSFDPANLRSTTFSLEWPPRSGKRVQFPEIDRAQWFSVPQARQKIVKGQTGFLDSLCKILQLDELRH